MSKVFNKVYDRIMSMTGGHEAILPETEYGNDLGYDSLDMVEDMMWAEEEFEIDIKDHEWESVKTVEDAARIIEGKLGIKD